MKGEDVASPRRSDVPENQDSFVVGSPGSVAGAPQHPLFLVKGDATPEEVAALAVVLQGLAAASTPAPDTRPVSEWSANHRRLRASYPAGPGGWRSSGLPR